MSADMYMNRGVSNHRVDIEHNQGSLIAPTVGTWHSNDTLRQPNAHVHQLRPGLRMKADQTRYRILQQDDSIRSCVISDAGSQLNSSRVPVGTDLSPSSFWYDDQCQQDPKDDVFLLDSPIPSTPMFHAAVGDLGCLQARQISPCLHTSAECFSSPCSMVGGTSSPYQSMGMPLSFKWHNTGMSRGLDDTERHEWAHNLPTLTSPFNSTSFADICEDHGRLSSITEPLPPSTGRNLTFGKNNNVLIDNFASAAVDRSNRDRCSLDSMLKGAVDMNNTKGTSRFNETSRQAPFPLHSTLQRHSRPLSFRRKTQCPPQPSACRPRRRPAKRRALNNSPEERRLKDNFLVRAKRLGWSYKEIKERGEFEEAESTLRGRYRTLTKDKKERLRRPLWTAVDLGLLFDAVHALPPLRSSRRPSWKKVAEYIVENGGSYRFGNATCRKKWDELNHCAPASA